ncbi:uncharacterized protein LOC131627549 [Vicia villosa]|uniref:uncharacterized protein LOC131627549 n=1 Tax=Vicia villosa TaxID=3911 RepID=UPI00273BD4F8|nr:uncharacterized protein LOC131627549 [Vicia villosa]
MAECVLNTVGSGKDVSFWFGLWTGSNSSLAMLFPDVFAAAVNPLHSVADLVGWEDSNHVWLVDRMVHSDLLTPIAADNSGPVGHWQVFLDFFSSVRLIRDGKDDFSWLPNAADFTVASVAGLIESKKEPAWSAIIRRNLKVIWKECIPRKIHIFMWRVCINRIPTKDALSRRGILDASANLCCEFCKSHLESPSHLFFSCAVSSSIWRRIYLWMGVDIPFSCAEFLDFGGFQEKVKQVNIRKKINLIWIATVWSLWTMRNSMIFDKV